MAAQDYLVSKVQKKRIQLVGILFFFASLIVLLKLGYIQIFKHNYYVIAASKQHYAFDNIPAKRGLIYVKDTDSGKLYPLAENIYQDMVFVSPKEVTSKEEAIIKLADILKKDREEIRSLFDSSETYVAIEHRLTDEQSQKIKNLNIKGVYLNKEEWRYYPENSLLSQALGYVDDEGNGQYGIEESYNDILKGVPGIYKAESDTGGQKIAFGRDVSKEAIDGKGIVLTINRDIQAEAEKILAEGVKKFGAEGGSIIVMEPKTGKILAMTSKPDFNPNDYKNEKNYELFKNKTITDTYEPGSIFKAITMSAGIDTGKVSPETEYEDAGQVVLNGHKIMNSDKKANGKQTMTQVLEKSLNTGVIFVLNKIGQSTFFDYVKRKFGFGERTGISLIGEASGQVLSEDEKEHTVATMTFGQSILTTPLQMINAFAAIANGGVIMRPQIIEKIIDKDGKEEEKQPEEIRRVISDKAAAAMTAMLVSVVEKGHGTQAKVKGYKVAGKTGTAQVPLKNGLGYDPSRNIGSFIGFAPAMSPEFVVMAKIDSPKGVSWAESTAAPIVGQVLDYLLKYYQVPPTELSELNQ